MLVADAAEIAARPHAERADPPLPWHDELAQGLFGAALAPWRRFGAQRPGRLQAFADRVAQHAQGLDALDDAELSGRLQALRPRLRREGFAEALVADCFALLQEASFRVLGRRHYPSQLMGGWALLQGRLVEMATGEGKTLTAVLPACTAALAGQPVHVVTVNDYLAQRDAADLAPLYSFLGLGVGTVVQGMAQPARRAAYAQAVTYCTNKELAFDYLRDRVALGHRDSPLHLALERLGGGPDRDQRLVMRGLHFAIVDEADSVFIDEARTPLILSSTRPNTESAEHCGQALDLARELVAGEDYRLDARLRRVELSTAGKQKIDAFAEPLSGPWTSTRGREALVSQALSALLLFRRDEHYVVAEGKVQIVDESTGRILPDRSWERGLHQLIEAKEGCSLSDERRTLARITYQRLFRRYVRLAGMTGTAREVAPEIRSVYRLDVAAIPLHRPSRRIHETPRLFATCAEKWQAVADAVQRLAVAGERPVLIGTRSVKASEEISAVLHARGIPHALLNAKQDQDEARVIAQAGQAGRVTVATNMAGRGTDIHLGPGVAERGGLHVILTEFHESRRIDRQLYGRCARQGDPGSCAVFVALEDELFAVHAPLGARLTRAWRASGRPLPEPAIQGLRRLAQSAAERKNARVRIRNLKHDRQLDQLLAFSGRQP
ncbi:preprotein translocase subunit SecA [Ramlibacter sp. 2FC]|uniref:preprotein translocase subunit SecA n=1 Tax=Ramlibacter sp. 2FC TaxID=2502188 RepID=UPI0014854FF5|nr:preprotein translocase subunit SecA [Ramlibacter sp. 2FC]